MSKKSVQAALENIQSQREYHQQNQWAVSPHIIPLWHKLIDAVDTDVRAFNQGIAHPYSPLPIEMNIGPELYFTVATLKPDVTLNVKLNPQEATITFSYPQPFGLTGDTIYIRADKENRVQMILDEHPIELDFLVDRLLSPIFSSPSLSGNEKATRHQTVPATY